MTGTITEVFPIATQLLLFVGDEGGYHEPADLSDPGGYHGALRRCGTAQEGQGIARVVDRVAEP